MTAAAPEIGQVAEVRGRRWVVTGVAGSTLPASPLEPLGNGQQNLVSLASLEDDGLGEELEVIWELEPGAQVRERVGLPDAPVLIHPDGSMPSLMPSAGALPRPPMSARCRPPSVAAST